MQKDTSLPKIWKKIIKKLNAERLEYFLVGAAALVIYGFPRSTLDIDIYVKAQKEALHKLFKIAESLGLQSEQKSILKVSHSPNLFAGQWICFSSKGQDILDVFLADGKEFSSFYKNSRTKKDKNISIRIASLDDIIAMKKALGRKQDLADIELIKEAQKIFPQGPKG